MRNYYYMGYVKFFCYNLEYTQLYRIRHFLHTNNNFFSILKYVLNSVYATVPTLGVRLLIIFIKLNSREHYPNSAISLHFIPQRIALTRSISLRSLVIHNFKTLKIICSSVMLLLIHEHYKRRHWSGL